jgi:hypothetical protein
MVQEAGKVPSRRLRHRDLVYLHTIKVYILTITYLLAYTLYVFSVTT